MSTDTTDTINAVLAIANTRQDEILNGFGGRGSHQGDATTRLACAALATFERESRRLDFDAANEVYAAVKAALS